MGDKRRKRRKHAPAVALPGAERQALRMVAGPAWIAVTAAVVALAVYVPRLCPSLCLIGDSGVFTSAAIVWGVPQPPGYPLFSSIGHLFALLPLGDVAWRVHLTSAVFHAAAVGVVARVLQRETGSAVAAVGGALFLAFSGLFFAGSLYAEAFPLNDLFTAVAIAAGLRVARAPAGEAQGRALRVFALVAGLASAHHQMIALATPALAVLVLPASVAHAREGWKRMAILFAIFAGAMAGGYALLPLAAMRDPWVNWGDVHDLTGLFQMITRADYGGMFSPALNAADQNASAHVVASLSDAWTAFGLVGWGLAVAGVASAWGRARRLALCVLLGFVVAGPVFAAANTIPIQDAAALAFASRFATMSHVFFGLAVGLGLAAAERGMLARSRRFAPVVGLAFVVPLVMNAASADLSRDTIGNMVAEDFFRDLPERAIVLGTGDAFHGASSYACAVERRCEGRTVLSPGQLHMPWRVAQLERRDPTLVLRTHEGPWPRPSDVLDDNVRSRPVLVTARLLDVDPGMRERSGYLPTGMLLRAVPEEEVARGKDALVRDALAMLDPGRCRGCRVGAFEVATSPLERGLVSDYSAALDNHARILGLVMGDQEDARVVAERAKGILEGVVK